MRVFERNPYSVIKTREIEDNFNYAHSETFGKIRVTYADQGLRYIVVVFPSEPDKETLSRVARIIFLAYANVEVVTNKRHNLYISRLDTLRRK